MPPSFSILVGTDFSENAQLALDRALDGARRGDGAALHVVSVLDDSNHASWPVAHRRVTLMQAVDRVRELLTADVAAAVDRYRTQHPDAPAVQPIIHVRLGRAAEQIAALATEIRAELVIVGTHGRRGLPRLLMGSVAAKTIRIAPCPVLVVRPTDFSAMAGLPPIDPPCPACVKAREASHGANWWCAAHAGERESAHTYSFSGRLTDPPTPRHHVL